MFKFTVGCFDSSIALRRKIKKNGCHQLMSLHLLRIIDGLIESFLSDDTNLQFTITEATRPIPTIAKRTPSTIVATGVSSDSPDSPDSPELSEPPGSGIVLPLPVMNDC